MERISLTELGKRFKAKYSGYEDKPAIEVGRELVRRYPRDYADKVILEEEVVGGSKEETALVVREQDSLSEFEDRFKTTADRSSVDDGVFDSWRKRRKMEARIETNKKIEEELESQERIENRRYIQSQRADYRKKEHEKGEASHATQLAEHKNKETYFNKASDLGVSPLANDQIRTLEEQARIEVDKEKKLLAARYEDFENREALTLQNRPEYDRLDLDKRWAEANQDLNASTIFALQHLKNAEQIRLYLADCYKRMDKLEKQKSNAAKRELDLLTDHVTQVEVQFRGAAKLLQGATQEDIQGSDPDTEDPRDPR
jgi:hypothetical protein